MSNITIRDTYYLIAQWNVGTYNLRLDANGGSLGNKRIFENVAFGTNIGTLELPTDGRGIPTKPGYIFQGWSESSANDTSTIFKGITSPSPSAAPAMPASDKTIYAVWKKDPSKFVVSFDSRGGNKISDHAYGSADVNYKAFTTPQRAGYTFLGWYPVDESGNMDDTVYTGGESLIKKEDHSFAAKWEPKNDTNYTIDYYVNSGSKDENGNYTYVRVTNANVNKTYKGTTESSVSVAEEDMLSELTVGGVSFWYNSDNENNLLTGKITGNPTLSLRLYYDRYFNVTASHDGQGTVTGALKQKEGSNPTVTWKADDGWHVSKVVIDGVIRDDLLSAGQFTYKYSSGIHEDHKIYVEFSQGTGKPAAVERFYEVKTSVVGCADESKYTITPTTSVNAGKDHQVTWEIKDSKYRVVKVEVDGIPYEGTDNTVTFTGIQGNHSVVVTLDMLSTIGGGTSEGQYTITVNRYGGDDKVKISSSQVVNAGDSAKVWWDVTDSDYMVYKFMIDGEEIPLGHGEKTTTKTYSRKPFTNVTANHVVDIYLTTPKEVDTIPPTFSAEDNIQVTTQFIGAPGSITGGAVLAKNSNYNVDWNVAENKNISLKVNDEGNPVDANGNPVDVNAEDYAFYEVEKIVVNGEEIKPDAQGNLPDHVALENLQNDASVQVYVRPVLHRVTILKYGEGEVSSSRTVYHLQDYKDLVMKPAAGWSTARIEVDGVVQDFLPEAVPETHAQEVISEEPVYETVEEPSEQQAMAPADTVEEETINLPGDEAEEEITELPIEVTEEEQTQLQDVTQLEEGVSVEDTVTIEQVYVQTKESSAPTEFSTNNITEEAGGDDGIMPLQDQITSRATVAPERHDGFEGIEEDHVVIVYFTRQDENGNPTPVPDSLHRVSVDILGGEGEVEGESLVGNGGAAEVTWKINQEKYEITGFTVNGQSQEIPADGKLVLDNIAEDKHIEITLSPRKLNNNDVVPPADFRKITHVINTIIHGGNGIIQGGGEVMDGSDRRISWELTDEGAEVKYVFVNGQQRDDLKDKLEVILSQIKEDQTVVVIIGKPDQLPVDVDKDGDGKPDINIDTDDDGKPDINIDTDGDGEPDINIDTDGDGKPDINIDIDGDGKPDINIDIDGDGKPDINIDKDGDGKPDDSTEVDGNNKPDTDVSSDEGNGSGKQEPSRVNYPVTKRTALPITGDEGSGVYGWIAIIDLWFLALILMRRRFTIKKNMK